jgi:hypothetical protein
MPRTVVLDEVFVTFHIPAVLPAAPVRVIRRTLMSRVFLTKLTAAVRQVVRSHPALSPVRVAFAR